MAFVGGFVIGLIGFTNNVSLGFFGGIHSLSFETFFTSPYTHFMHFPLSSLHPSHVLEQSSHIPHL